MCAFFAVATHVHAYTISVQQDPQASGVYNVVLDTEGQSFNAIAGTVFFDDKLTVTPTILTGSSVVSLWTKQPTVSGNSVVFEGLLPGGFSEVYDQFGDHPRTKVTIFSMSFPYQEGVPTLHFSFDSPTVYANDGTGMAIAVTALPSTLSAPLVTSATPVDTVPPEPFTIAVLGERTSTSTEKESPTDTFAFVLLKKSPVVVSSACAYTLLIANTTTRVAVTRKRFFTNVDLITIYDIVFCVKREL